MRNGPVKILQIQIGGKTFSGVASYLYQYYKHMDHTRVRYDFLFCRENSMELVQNDPVLEGSKFHVLNAKRGNSNDYRAITRGVHKVLEAEHYDAVVVNTSIIAVIYACLLGTKGVPNIRFIAHAHNTDLVLGKGSVRAKLLPLFKAADSILRKRICRRADYLFACTEDAGRVTFGPEAVRSEKYRLIQNAIDTELFSFRESVRKEIRNERQVDEETVVYGNVGSFCKRKNLPFLIRVFARVHERQPNSQLWLIGDGSERKAIESLVSELKLEDAVWLCGQRNDVNVLMQGMDCFVFSTLSEGLGIVAIEAQASGLPTVVSDGVPKDVLLTEKAIMLELGKGCEYWADEILKLSVKTDRLTSQQCIIEAGFDIHNEAKKLTDFFCTAL